MKNNLNQSTLIVLAHPEPRSFNGKWAQASAEASQASGHTVLFSDLVSMGFDPVEKRSHYEFVPDGGSKDAFDPLRMQDEAAKGDRLPAQVATEIDKVRQADRIIFHFPLWWFGPPAILKGWLERCLVHGALHSSSQRFDSGMCADKKVLFCVSTGSTAMESSPAGKEGDVNMLLWPLAYTLRYLGCTVLQPCLVHGVHGFHQGEAKTELEQRLEQSINNQAQLISNFDDMPVMSFNRDDEFDDRGVLKPSATSQTRFIHHN
ncbi:NAD(P)H-dependent oxidoreductase [Granulosicoccus antarcticus]|uniref:General stress protein 14 n=1 Tax=Granulosicoccus antarcticus IMCC3135 TaxID=1192854 RepID=A0A2Z2NJT6_9GAMM|nr:NAD(P)H-dependent oxidoreductase [Granulosicoccus antarcticus]ASJ71566.1 General stress protein 14 [Granulosicoccus antarcticus IMCC3135]